MDHTVLPANTRCLPLEHLYSVINLPDGLAVIFQLHRSEMDNIVSAYLHDAIAYQQFIENIRW